MTNWQRDDTSNDGGSPEPPKERATRSPCGDSFEVPETPFIHKARATWMAMWHSLPGQNLSPPPVPKESTGYVDHKGHLSLSRMDAATNVTNTSPQWAHRCVCGHVCKALDGLTQHWNANDKCRKKRAEKSILLDNRTLVRAETQKEKCWQALLASVQANMKVIVELWPHMDEGTFRTWFKGVRDIRRTERNEILTVKEYRLRTLNREFSLALGMCTNPPLLDLCTNIVRDDWMDIIIHSVAALSGCDAANLERLESVATLAAFLAKEDLPNSAKRSTFNKPLVRTTGGHGAPTAPDTGSDSVDSRANCKGERSSLDAADNSEDGTATDQHSSTGGNAGSTQEKAVDQGNDAGIAQGSRTAGNPAIMMHKRSSFC